MLKKCFIFLLLFTVAMANGDVCAQKKEKKTGNRKFRKYKTKEEKYEAAKTYYAKGSYLNAAQLLEEVYPLYLGHPLGDSILFLFSSSYYNNHDYLMAAFHFKDFARKYPQSEMAEEANFLAAKAYYLNMPPHELDQMDTYLAKENLELFINYFPGSKYIEESNAMLDSIRDQLSKKDFLIAKMYYRTQNYRSAQVSFSNLFKDYPESRYIEEALFILTKNNYEYALKSIEAKQVERFQAVIDIRNRLSARYPESKFLAEANKFVAESEKRMNKLLLKGE